MPRGLREQVEEASFRGNGELRLLFLIFLFWLDMRLLVPGREGRHGGGL